MAIPQFAMAHLPSSLATLRNVFSVSSYQNECSSATPRLKSASTLREHEVWKWTVPSSSAVMEWWWPSSACKRGDTRKSESRSVYADETMGGCLGKSSLALAVRKGQRYGGIRV